MKYYIAIPHQMPAREWFATHEELGEGDQFIEGDHDLSRILVAETKKELEDLLKYKGHQAVRVHIIAREILDREFRDLY